MLVAIVAIISMKRYIFFASFILRKIDCQLWDSHIISLAVIYINTKE